MEEKAKRPRVKIVTEEPIIDPLDFKPNAATMTGRLFHDYSEISVELWIDKHCHNRQIFGDEDGRREGIEINLVQDLVVKSFTYLMNMFLRNPNFQFIKYFNDGLREIRIVIQEENPDGIMLNVVIETHHLDMSKFEITVRTAMAVNDFRISDDQLVLTVLHDRAILKRFSKKHQNYTEVNRIDLN